MRISVFFYGYALHQIMDFGCPPNMLLALYLFSV